MHTCTLRADVVERSGRRGRRWQRGCPLPSADGGERTAGFGQTWQCGVTRSTYGVERVTSATKDDRRGHRSARGGRGRVGHESTVQGQ